MRTRTRVAAGGLTAVGLAAAGGLATAIPASAAQFCLDDGRAVACFESYGDSFHLRDTSADGLRPLLQWETTYGRAGEILWSGNDSWESRNYNLAERYDVAFRILFIDDSTGDIVDGTGWEDAPIGA